MVIYDLLLLIHFVKELLKRISANIGEDDGGRVLPGSIIDNLVKAPEHCAEQERVAGELAVPADDDQVPCHLASLQHIRQ